MQKAEKVFDIIVTLAVVLTGAGFGTFIGFVYSEERYWWVGLITGAVVAFPLTKFYLGQLVKAFKQGGNVWLRGTFAAVVSGIFCTTVIHGIMAALVYPEGLFVTEIGNLVPITIIIGEIVGAVAGLIVGGICSGVYMAKIMDEASETA